MSKPKRSPEDIAAEIRAHLDLEADALQSDGLPSHEARRQAHLAFGNASLTRERVYLHHRGSWLQNFDSLHRDLAFGLRSFARNPGFTLTVTLTLALAIGANTAIFSLVNALLLKSLPYPQPERLATTYLQASGEHSGVGQMDLDGEEWELLRDNVPALIPAISSGITSGVNLQAGSAANTPAGQIVQYLHAARISAHYFDVLATPPLLGRAFSEIEDRPNGPRVAILSYSLWHTTFHADPAILGRPITLKGEPYSVIGVLPDRPTPLDADIYTALQPSRDGEGSGDNYNLIVRLRDSATWQQANDQLNRAWAPIAARITRSSPSTHASFHLVPLQQSSTAELRPQVLVLQLAAGFILLIACANLAGLTLVRTLRRTAEFATRLALGASRGQILRQIWIENLLLALTGGLISIAVAYLALRGLLALFPEHFLPVAQVTLDLRVLVVALLTTLATSVLFGMLPALATRKIDLRSSIAARSAPSQASLRLRQALIAGEVALTVVLLAASGLLIRTLIHLETLPPGFNPSGLFSAKASLDEARYHDPAAFNKLLAASTLAMRQIPGIQNAAVGLNLPYERPLNDQVTFHDGPRAGQSDGTQEIYVTPNYFETLQIPLLAGRTFSDSDTATSQPVVIINRSFARKFFPNQDPLGHTVNKDARIIGIVADVVSHSGFSDAPIDSVRTLYVPASQLNPKLLAIVHAWFQPSWIVRTVPGSTISLRTSLNPSEATLSDMMHNALASADPNLPISGFYSMNDLQARSLATQRIEVALLSSMAALALLLSGLGIFALVANLVAQRTREIGIRIALGSSLRQAMLNIGQAGLLASAAGLLAGCALSAVALRALRSVLYGISVYDAPTLLTVLAALTLLILLATTLPTLRIAKIHPAQTLREE